MKNMHLFFIILEGNGLKFNAQECMWKVWIQESERFDANGDHQWKSTGEKGQNWIRTEHSPPVASDPSGYRNSQEALTPPGHTVLVTKKSNTIQKRRQESVWPGGHELCTDCASLLTKTFFSFWREMSGGKTRSGSLTLGGK
jgi:hypothetical protein